MLTHQMAFASEIGPLWCPFIPGACLLTCRRTLRRSAGVTTKLCANPPTNPATAPSPPSVHLEPASPQLYGRVDPCVDPVWCILCGRCERSMTRAAVRLVHRERRAV
eukprot:7666477-Pyramimonas_sp.AAC.1